MKLRTIIGIIILLIVCMFGISVAGMYFSYNNEEVSLRKQIDAQKGKVENHFDQMWKIISQKAQITEQYKEAFKEIYPELISGRYDKGDGTLMKWIQEANPEFDTSLYKDLMQTVEVQRIAFSKTQDKMLDLIREHSVLIETYPAKWFVTNTTPIEYTIISSSKSKMTMETGIDDDVTLFTKDAN